MELKKYLVEIYEENTGNKLIVKCFATDYLMAEGYGRSFIPSLNETVIQTESSHQETNWAVCASLDWGE